MRFYGAQSPEDRMLADLQALGNFKPQGKAVYVSLRAWLIFSSHKIAFSHLQKWVIKINLIVLQPMTTIKPILFFQKKLKTKADICQKQI